MLVVVRVRVNEPSDWRPTILLGTETSHDRDHSTVPVRRRRPYVSSGGRRIKSYSERASTDIIIIGHAALTEILHHSRLARLSSSVQGL